MIRDVAKVLMNVLSDLPFIDKLGGYTEVTPESGKAMPVSCDYVYDNCEDNQNYVAFIPEHHLKSMLFFEGVSNVNVTEKKSKDLYAYTVDFNLIGWINKNKLGYEDCNTSSIIINQIIKRLLDQKRINDVLDVPFQALGVTSVRENLKTPSIFTKYGFKDEFRFDPYDYFSIGLTVKFYVDYKCIVDFEIKSELTC